MLCGSFHMAGVLPLGSRFTVILSLLCFFNDFGLGSTVGLGNFTRMLICMSSLTVAHSTISKVSASAIFASEDMLAAANYASDDTLAIWSNNDMM